MLYIALKKGQSAKTLCVIGVKSEPVVGDIIPVSKYNLCQNYYHETDCFGNYTVLEKEGITTILPNLVEVPTFLVERDL